MYRVRFSMAEVWREYDGPGQVHFIQLSTLLFYSTVSLMSSPSLQDTIDVEIYQSWLQEPSEAPDSLLPTTAAAAKATPGFLSGGTASDEMWIKTDGFHVKNDGFRVKNGDSNANVKAKTSWSTAICNINADIFDLFD